MSKVSLIKPCIVGGDFNCRIDSQSPDCKGDCLVELMEDFGFTLVNQADEYTYLCWNGKSTLDLYFTNTTRCIVSTEVLNITSRKHLPVVLTMQLDDSVMSVQKHDPVQYSRRINRQLLNDPPAVEALNARLSMENIDGAAEALTSHVSKSLSQNPSRRRKKRWYNRECRKLHKELKTTLHCVRGRRKSTHGANSGLLCMLRKEYHAFVNASKLRCKMEDEAIAIARAEQQPYTYIRKKKIRADCKATANAVKEHFYSLLHDPEAQQPEVQITLPLTFEQWLMNTPWTPQEVIDIVTKLPKGKSAGPDGIFYEHWKATVPALASQICLVFNRILEEGKIPKAWHYSRLTLLFKGKFGDPADDMNLYRGIASEDTLKKIFFKGLIRRIETSVERALPPQQFGFRRGVGTRDALHVVISEIERSLASPTGHLYAVFIDCRKAFDRAPRKLMLSGFEKAGVNGQALKVIESFFDQDSLTIPLGQGNCVDVTQNRGTPQGDPLSCTAFTLLLADLPRRVQEEFKTGLIVMFADDIIIAHKNKLLAQKMLYMVGSYLKEKGLELNPAKTQVVKFRKGGRLSSQDRIYWDGKRLEFASTAKYLGVRLQTTGLTFTQHVEEASCKGIKSMYADIGNPYLLSIGTAVKLFLIKAIPLLAYGLERLWSYLTESNFRTLEKCFTVYIKRTLRVSKTARNRYLYIIIGLQVPVTEIIRTRVRGGNTEAFKKFCKEWTEKVDSAKEDLANDPILEARHLWEGPDTARRHVFTRYLVHGYHHHLCIHGEYHSPAGTCVCKHCGGKCPRDHALRCHIAPNLSALSNI